MFITLITVMLAVSVIAPFAIMAFDKQEKTVRFKKALTANASIFVLTMAVACIMMATGTVFAQTEPAAQAAAASSSSGMGFLAAALSTGLAAIGAGVAVGGAASAALGAISENEKLMGKALIFVALAEGIALYGLLISFFILNKI